MHTGAVMKAQEDGRPAWHNAPEAEVSVVGALLMDADACGRVIPNLSAADFTDGSLRIAVSTMRRIHERGGVPDPVTLREELASRGLLADFGGLEGIAELMDAVPTAANVEYHVAILRDRSLRRRLRDIADDSRTPAAAAVRGLLDTDTPASGRKPIALTRLLEGDPPAPPRMHTDRLLLAGDINVIVGAGDAGKSTSMFSIAISTVLGRRVFGSLPVRTPGPVVLVVPEDGEAVARHHVDALVAGLEPPASDTERERLACDLRLVGDDRRIDLLSDTAELGKVLADIQPTLLIAEPISELIGSADENEERVAQAVCHNLRRDICRPLGTAVLLAGHVRKPGRDGGEVVTVNDMKGSAGWPNHSRLVWLVSKPKGGDTMTFRLVKSNRIRTGTEHQVTLEIEADPDNEAHWHSARLTDANLGTSSQSYTPGVGRAINENERKALDALDDRHEPGLRLSYSAWCKRSGIGSENTFKDVRARLIEAGLVEPIRTGRKARNGGPEYAYAVTDGGRNALATGWNRG